MVWHVRMSLVASCIRCNACVCHILHLNVGSIATFVAKLHNHVWMAMLVSWRAILRIVLAISSDGRFQCKGPISGCDMAHFGKFPLNAWHRRIDRHSIKREGGSWYPCWTLFNPLHNESSLRTCFTFLDVAKECTSKLGWYSPDRGRFAVVGICRGWGFLGWHLPLQAFFNPVVWQ